MTAWVHKIGVEVGESVASEHGCCTFRTFRRFMDVMQSGLAAGRPQPRGA
jgi:hypothetical protein